MENQLNLVYFYDALCGWCYGFSPVIKDFVAAHGDEFEVEVFSGGMITGERVGPIGEVAGYIKDAYQQVEKASGVAFGEAFLDSILEEGTATFTSIPPAVAMAVFKTIQPEKAVDFATRLQSAIYYDGIKPADIYSYPPLAEEFGIDASSFLEKMKDTVFMEAAFREFAFAERMKITGFPTLILHDGTRAILVARGFLPKEKLEESYVQAKAELAKAEN
ncbi:MAG TPA: DsbA family protein [Saprospiraceae bacterium]|nr:DsbA family protein [Saprospiraceae bacterium]